MTQADKLQALTQKAVESGFDGDDYMFDTELVLRANTLVIGGDEGIHVFALIFNHDFAKALFGEGELELYYDKALVDAQFKLFGGTIFSSIGTLPAFQAHVMLASVADDPIEYLYGAVFDE